jgi:nucleoside 2-deoxyribosyltransferase
MKSRIPPCPVCRADSRQSENPKNLVISVKCSRCGIFRITREAKDDFDPRHSQKISGWIYDQNSDEIEPILDSQTLKRIASHPPLGLLEKADRLLLHAVETCEDFISPVNFLSPQCISAIHGKDMKEVLYVVGLLREKGRIRYRSADKAHITPEGFIHAEEVQNKKADSDQGFVALWVCDELKDAYDSGFQTAILQAGYRPIVVDRAEHVKKIDDVIIAQIRRSRFLVADFTGHRGEVYFEAGYALGLNLPVIWTCRKDEIHELYFDIRQHNCIDWENTEELARRLQSRIEAVIGDGPLKERRED